MLKIMLFGSASIEISYGGCVIILFGYWLVDKLLVLVGSLLPCHADHLTYVLCHVRSRNWLMIINLPFIVSTMFVPILTAILE